MKSVLWEGGGITRVQGPFRTAVTRAFKFDVRVNLNSDPSEKSINSACLIYVYAPLLLLLLRKVDSPGGSGSSTVASVTPVSRCSPVARGGGGGSVRVVGPAASAVSVGSPVPAGRSVAR